MRAEEFAGLFPDAEKTTSGWMVVCPAHGDTEGSLHVSPGDDDRAMLKCHGGCATEDVVAAMGLGMKDLFADEPATVRSRSISYSPKPTAQEKAKAPLRLVEAYDYTDEDGNLLYQALRYEPKTFRQRRPDGKGGWSWSMKGQRKVLYRLPEVLAAVERGETVYIVEGEKDVASAERIGLTATTNVAGAGKWSDDYCAGLASGRFVVLPDVDDDSRGGKAHRKGQIHGAAVARSLGDVAESVQVYEFEHVKDLSEWVAVAGKPSKEDLEALIEADAVTGSEYVAKMKAWEASVKSKVKQAKLIELHGEGTAAPAPFENTDQTDIGASDRIVQRFGDTMRYCNEFKRWYVWNGAVWEEDRRGIALSRAKQVARENTLEALPKGGQALKKAYGMESAGRIKGALELAAVDEKVSVMADVFDRHQDVMACPSGVINLRTGELMEPDPGLMLTRMAPTEYDPGAKCPAFNEFLMSIMLGDAEMVEFLWRWLGYCVTGQTREQVLVVAHGSGANGKGTLFDTVSDVIGPFAAEAPQTLLLAKRQENHPAELMTVRGKRMVTASEVKKGSAWDESRVKWLTGEDTITARGMRQDFVSWKPTHKLCVYLNNKPVVKDDTDAFWRRMLFVPFLGSFKPGTPAHDPLLRDKLTSEHQGILAWLVRGAVAWYDAGLTRPGGVIAATEEYRADEDRFGAWMEHYRLGNSGEVLEQSSNLFKDYKAWCERNNERTVSQRDFVQSLVTAGAVKKKKKDGNYYLLKALDDGWRVEANGTTAHSPHTRTHMQDNLKVPPSASTFHPEAEADPKTAQETTGKPGRNDDGNDDDMPSDGFDF